MSVSMPSTTEVPALNISMALNPLDTAVTRNPASGEHTFEIQEQHRFVVGE